VIDLKAVDESDLPYLTDAVKKVFE